MRLLVLLPVVLSVLVVPRVALAAGADFDTRMAVAAILRGEDVHSQILRLQYLKREKAGARLLTQHVYDGERVTRRNVALALASLAGPAELAVLRALAEDEDGAVRLAAATGLGRAGPKAAGILVELLGDKTYGVRREAARALGKVGGPKQGMALAKLLAPEEELEVQVAALIALGQMKATGQKRHLLGALETPSRSKQDAAARGLVLMGDAAGFRYVRERLASDDVHTRLGGLELLAGIPLKVLSPIAKPLLEDDEHRIRAAAATHLAQAGEKRARLWLILAAHEVPAEQRRPYTLALETLLVTEAESNAVLRKAGRLK